MLTEFDIARVAADPPAAPQGDAPGGTAGWQYWRLHGSPRIYYSNYDPATLKGFKARLSAAKGAGERWCIFDNTAHGHAVPNALWLRDALRGRGGGGRK